MAAKHKPGSPAHAHPEPARAGPVKLRVIFRGLIWFHFDVPRDQIKPTRQDRGTLRVYLVNDADGEHADHYHAPRMAVIGRDGHNGNEILGRPRSIAGQRVEIGGIKQKGVTPHPSFHRHVPWLREVYGAPPGAPDWNLVAAEVILPGGQVRARNLVTWTCDLHGANRGDGPEIPVNMGFFWDPKWEPRALAHEAVLEADLENGELLTALSPQTYSEGIPERIRPLTLGPRHRLEIDPDVVDILITNFPAKRPGRVPWSAHYQLLFKAAGFAPMRYGAGFTDQFEPAARAFHPDHWAHDYHMMNGGRPQGLPIPHLVGAKGQPFGPVQSILCDPPWEFCLNGEE